jgi:hypothetical protein
MAKIRFVASSLLDTLSSPSGDTGTGGINSDLPVRLQKAQSYLCKFKSLIPSFDFFYTPLSVLVGELTRYRGFLEDLE